MNTVCPVESVFCVCCVAKLMIQDENVVNLVGLSYTSFGSGWSQPGIILSVVIEDSTSCSEVNFSHHIKIPWHDSVLNLWLLPKGPCRSAHGLMSCLFSPLQGKYTCGLVGLVPMGVLMSVPIVATLFLTGRYLGLQFRSDTVCELVIQFAVCRTGDVGQAKRGTTGSTQKDYQYIYLPSAGPPLFGFIAANTNYNRTTYFKD